LDYTPMDAPVQAAARGHPHTPRARASPST